MKEEYKYVDILKFAFAISVVLQHSLIPFIQNGLYAFFNACIMREAIPFFFVASGFFFGRKLYKAGMDLKRIGGGLL